MPEESENTEARLTILEKDMARVHDRFEKARKWLDMDAEVSLGQARKAAEAICKQIYVNEGCEKGSKPADKLMLNDLIGRLMREKLIPQRIGVALGTIQAFGNLGAHDQGEESDHITADTATPCLNALSTVVTWYSTEYHKYNSPASLQKKKGQATAPDFAAEEADGKFRLIAETVLIDGHISVEEQMLLEKKWSSCGISQQQAWDVLIEEIEKLPGCTMDAPATGAPELFFHLHEALSGEVHSPSKDSTSQSSSLSPLPEEEAGQPESNGDESMFEALYKRVSETPAILSDTSLSWGNQIPAKKLANARSEYHIPETESIICLHDSTVFGSAKNGIALCESGMAYFNNPWHALQSGAFSVQIAEIEPESILITNSEVRFGTFSYWACNSAMAIQGILLAFRKLL